MLRFNNILKRRLGLTYIEIMISITIILSIFVGITGIFGVAIRNSKKSENIYIAQGLAQGLMEQIKSRDFVNVVNVGQTNVNGFLVGADVIPNYLGNPQRKLVSVTVSGADITNVQLDCIVANPAL